jgi:hypothetical protein
MKKCKDEKVVANCVFYLLVPVMCHYSVTVLTHQTKQNKQTPWPLVRERTIQTERLSLVDEI